MHIACMPTKTISLKIQAYERLRSARRYPEESFSEVVLRATWPERTITAGELLSLTRSREPLLAEDALDAIERLKETQESAPDKWQAP